MGTKEYSYTVLFEPAEEGGYVVTCPALPGLVTEGDTLERSAGNGEGCDPRVSGEPAEGRIADPL